MFSKLFLAFLLVSSGAFASYDSAEKSFGGGSVSKKTIVELVNDGFYFSVIPWVKDHMVKSGSNLDSDMERAIDRIIAATGVKPFESLPENVLRRSRSANIRYILAKRHFKQGENEEALNQLGNVDTDHPAFPFIANLKGAISAQLGRHADAENLFRDCVRYSNRMIGKSDSLAQKDQFETNRDFCLAGIARVQFATGDFKKSELGYLDVEKDSFVWPEILFEEAWTSYYLKNYNRTLGKLVSYKAPVFDFIFKPEVEVLKALTYLKMCLYDDARKTADDFYTDLLNPSRDLRRFLLAHGKDYKYFYNLMADYESEKSISPQIVGSILKSIKKDAAYMEMKAGLSAAVGEYNSLRKRRNGSLQGNLTRNIKVVLDEYRTLLGAYVRAGMVSKYAELFSAFQGMSYIKLEVLAQRKERLYQSDEVPGRKRGDVKYIERNDKQYFWTFNGEFWADELGDYVFALRSEC